ncbi:MAG: hypothetical protein GX127_01570 [Eubacteriaceae bacterium]|nr:hypothetical protein [Eubacteriaceae bacterium]
MIKKYWILGISLLMIWTLSGCSQAYDTDISLASGEYLGEQTVVLSNEEGGVTTRIYYTLDGSDPTKESMQYDPETPLKINFDAHLKAATIGSNKRGPIAEAEYKITPIKQVELTDEERVFLSILTGTYQSDTATVTIASDRTITINDGNKKHTTEFLLEVPEDSDNKKGTLTFSGLDGSSQEYHIDFDPPGDNAIDINGTSYTYLGY